MPDILQQNKPALSAVSDTPRTTDDPRSAGPTGLQGTDSYSTPLSPDEMQQFKSWVKQNNIPHYPAPNAQYDTEGHWKAMQDAPAKDTLVAHPGFKQMAQFMTPFHPQYGTGSQYHPGFKSGVNVGPAPISNPQGF